MHFVTSSPVYRRLLDFWLKIFGVVAAAMCHTQA
jgi:hypothetical protein